LEEEEQVNVFCTGGSGFIGSHLCQKLSEKNQVVTIVRDLFPTQTPWGKWLSEALNRTQIVLGDILNIQTVKRLMAEYDIDTVTHFAAQAIVKTAQKDPSGTFQTNVQGTVTLLEACRQLGIPTIYVQSTDKVYGERMDAIETDPLVSTGPYETSKACADLTAQSFMETYGMNIIIGRPCNTYGYDMAKRIIPNTIKACLNGEPPIIFESEKYEGEKTIRQYIYVEDLVDAIQFLIAKAQKGIYNIGTDDILTQEEVVKNICKYFPLTPRLMKRDKPIKEIQKQTVNWSKLENLGWQPKHTFDEAIQKTIGRFTKYGFA
jgi:CDP-glucose 4,6-dehydratase